MSQHQLCDAALIIVDFQEDFCPPKGALAIPDGRSISAPINELLKLPWSLRVATQDWHPSNHVSFASNHENKMPFEQIDVPNPLNPKEAQTIVLWPDHCIQDSEGAVLVPELDASRIDHVVKKGQDHRVEMFSAFRDDYQSPCVSTSDLASVLREKSIRRAYVVGLARDFCVKATALHAAAEGFDTTVLAEATRGTDDSADAIEQYREDLGRQGVKYMTIADAKIR